MRRLLRVDASCLPHVPIRVVSRFRPFVFSRLNAKARKYEGAKASPMWNEALCAALAFWPLRG